MEMTTIALQIIIALGIVNVWVLRPRLATAWRGGDARTLREEFAAYGLPGWVMGAVGTLKLGLAALLLVGIVVPGITRPAALGMAVLMTGAIAMHVKVGDPLKRSLPALTMLLLSLAVAAA